VLVASTNSAEGEQPTEGGVRAADIALGDPLKPETRKARLYLLAVSMVGITVVKTGLAPQEISTFGIKFGEADQRSLLAIFAVVTIYFLAAFAIYGLSDFFAWRYSFARAPWPESDRLRERIDAERRRLNDLYEERDELLTKASRSDNTEQLNSVLHEIWALQHFLDNMERIYVQVSLVSALPPSGIALVRGVFEFLLPILVGLYAIYTLLFD
jgi:hypothetical protein